MHRAFPPGRPQAARPDRPVVGAVLCLLGLFYVAFYVAFYWNADGFIDANGHALGRDFVNDWTASKLLLAGRVGDIFDLRLFHETQGRLLGREYPPHLWSYPPSALFFVAPFGLLPYLWAYAVWSLATFALYLRAVCAGRCRLGTALALALAPATFVNLFAGQNGFLTGALLLGGLGLLERRPILAGFLFGLLSFKPQLAVLVPVALIAARQWRAFGVAALTGAALVGASVIVFGVEPWWAYLSVNMPAQAALLDHGQGPFIYMMATPFMSARLLGLGAPADYLVQAAFSLGAAVLVYRVFAGEPEPWRRAAVLLAATFLAVPYAFNYDMTLLSVAVVWSYQRRPHGHLGIGPAAVLALAWTLPLTVFALDESGAPAGPLILVGFLWLLLHARPAAIAAAQPRPSSS